MVGIMSAEMYYFYTGQYYKSLDSEMWGVMPLNAFQYQADDPLSTLLSATSNSTAVNFKITDICETGIYNTKDKDPKIIRVEPISTVHICQNPKSDSSGDGEEEKKMPAYSWDENDVPLVDHNFNLHFSDKDERIVNEIAIQAIGAGNITKSFYALEVLACLP